ncbi:dihydrolipoamide acetyltransferase family protein [Afifella pfennigii]|uniref:dihydrolipoamide acetyltransferase family protein n=1 Tax=Afifella pfennigii TaxID=209897 RepID=UPI000479AC39|nr:dihydrolipoamide acetyltransferase family protein [Afifella pfennigii]
MIDFAMPSLGADMDAGTLVEWFIKPGDAVRRGDIIALVETQKGAIEIEVFQDGRLGDIKVGPGERVPVGTVLATILEPGETVPSPAAETPPSAVEEAAPPAPLSPRPPMPQLEAERAVPAAAPGEAAATRPRITPAARRQAAEKGIDLATVSPGAEGVIGLAEIAAVAAIKPAPAGETRARRPGIDLGEMRKAIAAAMSRSHRDIPHYWVSQTIDLTALFAWLEAENAKRSTAERLLYAAPLIKAVALALKERPELNGHYGEAGFVPAERVHLGIATALRGGGLVAPALHDADSIGLEELMTRLADLIPRARAGRLRSSELSDASATFSNLGEGTSEAIMPLIYPPQVAIVGCGAATLRPFVVGGKVEARRLLTVTVAGDHRVSDGRRASQFLARLDALLQKPEAL